MDNSYFSTDKRIEQLLKAQESDSIVNDHDLEVKKKSSNSEENKLNVNSKIGKNKISDKVLNSPKKLVGGYGCINPESVNQYNEYIYFWSKKKGCALRYNIYNGIFDISGGYNARSYFFNQTSNKCQPFGIKIGTGDELEQSYRPCEEIFRGTAMMQ